MWTTFYAFSSAVNDNRKVQATSHFIWYINHLPQCLLSIKRPNCHAAPAPTTIPGLRGCHTGSSSPSLFGFLGVLSFLHSVTTLEPFRARAGLCSWIVAQIRLLIIPVDIAVHRLTTHIIMSRGKSAKCGLRPALLFEGEREETLRWWNWTNFT